MKKIFIFSCTLISLQTIAQKQGTLYIKGGEKVLVNTVKKTGKETSFFYKDSLQKNTKTSMPNFLIDSLIMGKIDTAKTIENNLVSNTPSPANTNAVVDLGANANNANAVNTPQALPTNSYTPEQPVQQPTHKISPWKFTLSVGLEIGNLLEFNSQYSGDKKTFTFNTAIDATANYRKEGNRFAITNELHYLFGVQKESVGANGELQKVQDNLNLLHDVSLAMGKKSNWNYNTIIRTNTSLFNIYDGDYFKNVTGLGKKQAFGSPYSISVAPGIKYETSSGIRFSVSPYSFQITGVLDNEVAQKGIYITDTTSNGSFKNFLFKRQGAEANLWFDKRIKEWCEIQYRLTVTADYVEGFTQTGKLDGLLITRFRLTKNLFLTHRASIDNLLDNNFWKPHFVQNVMLSFNKTF